MSARRRAYVNARLVDPESGLDAPGALLTEGGEIADLGPRLFADGAPGEEVETIDCAGLALAPGLIDLRVFVGEPGLRHKESYKSAGAAAAAGGIATMVTMPNTAPVLDDAPLVEFIMRRARAASVVRVAPMAALTKGLQGEEMTEIGFLRDAGAVGFTDGRHAVANPVVMRRAMTYAKAFGALIAQHAEEPTLAATGCATEGEFASRLGLPGVPAVAETMMIARDMRLLALSECRFHVSQISVGESLGVVARAKGRGLSVTCAVSAAHVALNEADIGDYRTFFKTSPPLRAESDRAAMVDGLVSGEIDALVSSHDPQDQESKRRPFAQAADGAVGLETLLPIALSLHHQGRMSLLEALKPVTIGPARILGTDRGRLARGAPADLVLIDVDRPWRLGAADLKSKSKNTPFDGRRFQGRAARTVVAGETVFEA